MDITEDGAVVDNSSFLSGNPALRIIGNGVRFTNKAGGWIFGNPDDPQTEPVILLSGSQIIFINELGGNIRARDRDYVVLQGSQYADHVENYGILEGKVSLGGGNDYYYGLINTSLNQPQSFDLGDGDDTLVFDVSDSNYLSFIDVEGGAGYDRITITGFHIYPSGYPGGLYAGHNFTGVERIDLSGVAGAATRMTIDALHTGADLYFAPAMSVEFKGETVEIGDIHLDGGDINIINGASVGDIFGGDAPEWVRIGHGGNTSIPLTFGEIWLGGGSDSVAISWGQMSALTVHGGGGGDLLQGGELADSLFGDAGDDRIRGYDGDDFLSGGEGADRIDGGRGNDSLTGGSGGDHFIFNYDAPPGAIDTITDFEVGTDKIFLSVFVFSHIGYTMDSWQFYVGSQAQTSLTRIIYNSATGALLYDRDGTNSGFTAVQFAALQPGLALTHQDFILTVNGFPTFREAGHPIVRISTGANGEQANGQSSNGIFAPNGRFVVFESAASNLVAGDLNGKSDIFLKNLEAGTVFRLSVGPAQEEANGNSTHPVFSADGLKLLYESAASNLVAGDTPGTLDLFMLDFTTGQTSLVSSSAGGAFGNGTSLVGGFSPDGTKVVFVSAASNLVAGDTNGAYDIFIKDLASGAVTLVAAAGPLLSGVGKPVFSPDGTKILFQSEADNLVAGDTNGKADLFIKDLFTGTITRVSTGAGGVEANHISSDGTFSPDGSKILFQSAASNLLAGDTNNNFDIFIKDLATGQITLVSGFTTIFGNGGSSKPVFSPDGTKVAFYSFANNLAPGDTNGNFDIFVKDLVDGSIIRVSVGATGAEANDSSYYPSFSADGMSVIFHSGASNLVAGDTNGASASYDTFIVDIGSRYTENGAGAVIATSLIVGDDSDNYMSGDLTAYVSAGMVIGDQITLAAVGGVTVTANQVAVNGIVVGMIDVSGSMLRIALNANADDAAVTALTQALRFSSTSDTPTNGTRTITITLGDGGGDNLTNYGGSFRHQVAVTEVNDAPILAATAGKAAFIEGADVAGTPVAIDPGLVITDVDASRITDATINVTMGAPGDLLGFVNNDAAAFGDIHILTSNGGALQLHSSGSATRAQWQNALRAVTYANTEDAPITSDRTISFSLRDSDAQDHGILSNTITRQLTVTAANDTPVNHLPAAQSFDENHVLSFGTATGNAITISDADAVGSSMTVSLTVADGALSLTSGYLDQTGSGTNHLVVTGSVAQVNAALQGLTYTPVADANGPRSITIVTADGGQAGSVNLIVNPGAETGEAYGQGSIVSPPGWTIVSGNMSAVLYEAPGSGNLVADNPSFGTDYFAGGFGNPFGEPAIISQTVDLLAFAGSIPSLADIDAGLVQANLSGSFGGHGAENDNMVLTARFLGAGGAVLGTVQIGGVLAVDRGGATLLVPRETSPGLPPGTRSIELVLTAYHSEGPYIDAYADQLSLTLSKIDVDILSVNIIADPHDILFGTPGADVMAAGPGNDLYHVDNAGDQVIEAVGEGADRVIASVSYTLGSGSEVETLEAVAGSAPLALTGNSFAQAIIGTAGANVLNGGGGADTLTGLGGDDTYIVDNAGDAIVEAAGQGYDTVYASASYTLAAGVSVEILSTANWAGTAPLALGGNNLGNIVYGNAGHNLLDGGAGADLLNGMGGDDVYILDNAADAVVEAAGGGYDTLFTSVSYTLAAGVSAEVLSAVDWTATGALNLTGNALANRLYGNAGANVLTGGEGDDLLWGLGGGDTLIGGVGDDVYWIYALDDGITETGGNGYDTTYLYTSYALGADANVEVMSTFNWLGFEAINLTANSLSNTIYGNAGVNTLNGGSGADLLVGLGGADTFAFTTALGGGNVDTIADFVAGTDKVALDDAIFTAIGTLNADAFVIGPAAADINDRIVYNSTTGALFYDADGSGAGAAIQFATLTPGLALTAGDFTMI